MGRFGYMDNLLNFLKIIKKLIYSVALRKESRYSKEN
jgi:hypothetical protein